MIAMLVCGRHFFAVDGSATAVNDGLEGVDVSAKPEHSSSSETPTSLVAPLLGSCLVSWSSLLRLLLCARSAIGPAVCPSGGRAGSLGRPERAVSTVRCGPKSVARLCSELNANGASRRTPRNGHVRRTGIDVAPGALDPLGGAMLNPSRTRPACGNGAVTPGKANRPG